MSVMHKSLRRRNSDIKHMGFTKSEASKSEVSAEDRHGVLAFVNLIPAIY